MIKGAVLFLLVAACFADTASDYCDSYSNGNCQGCDSDSDCPDNVQIAKFMKYTDGEWKADTVKQKCCSRGGQVFKSTVDQKYKGLCFDDRAGECKKTDDTYGKNVVCTKKLGFACGDTCCNKYTEICKSWKPTNKPNFKYYSCQPRTLVDSALMAAAFAPVVGFVTQILAFLSIALIAKNIINHLPLSGKLALGLGLLATFFSMFFYFSYNAQFNVWVYPVLITIATGFAAASLSSTSRFLHWITVFIHFFVLLSLLGLNGSGAWSFGPGLFNAVPATPKDCNSNDAYHGHFAYSFSQNADVIQNPALDGWGYCSRSFVSFHLFNALFMDALIACVLVAHIVALFTSVNAETSALEKPLMH